MKICFTGPLTGFSGFSTASRLFLKTLDFASAQNGIQLTARDLRYDVADPGSEYQIPDWLGRLFHNDLRDVDMLIQSTTCNVEAVPKPGICNALYTFFELDRIPPSWAAKANEFDFIIVPCKFNANMLMNCGVTKPILVMPPPCDGDYFDLVNNPPTDTNLGNVGNRTVFYNICQLSSKKGIDLLIRAYLAAFVDMPDEVLLVLKTYINMQQRHNEHELVKSFINQVKQNCQIPLQKLPPIIPITRTMSENEIRGIHAKCDAYVNTSRGEGWGLPAFDALAFGKTVISNSYGGMADYVSDQNSLIIGGTISNIYAAPHPDPFLYNGVSRWFESSTAHTADLMRNFHLLKRGASKNELNEHNNQLWNKILDMRVKGREMGQRFDYRRIAPLIVDNITAALKNFKQTGVVKFSDTQKV